METRRLTGATQSDALAAKSPETALPEKRGFACFREIAAFSVPSGQPSTNKLSHHRFHTQEFSSK